MTRGGQGAQLRHQGSAGAHACEVEARDHREGFRHIGAALRYDLPPGELVAIGHRVVHGGERLRALTPIDAPAREAIRELLVRADDENAHRRAGPADLRERPARPRIPRPIERDPELLQARARELQIARETLASVRPAPPG
jgi:hypothetical protein